MTDRGTQLDAFDIEPQDFDLDFELEPPDEAPTGLPNVRLRIRSDAKRKLIDALAQESADAIITRLPAPGESWHVVSNGTFNFYSIVRRLIPWMAGSTLHISTWTLFRNVALDIGELLDDSSLREVYFLTGTYMRQRDPYTYQILESAIRGRGQHCAAVDTHAKIAVIQNDADAIAIESSANFCSNPRIENFTLYADRELAEFHAAWIQDLCLATEKQQAPR